MVSVWFLFAIQTHNKPMNIESHIECNITEWFSRFAHLVVSYLVRAKSIFQYQHLGVSMLHTVACRREERLVLNPLSAYADNLQ